MANYRYIYCGPYIKCPKKYGTSVRTTQVCSICGDVNYWSPYCSKDGGKIIEKKEEEEVELSFYSTEEYDDKYEGDLTIVASPSDHSDFEFFRIYDCEVFHVSNWDDIKSTEIEITSDFIEHHKQALADKIKELGLDVALTKFYGSYEIKFGILDDPEY